MMEGEFVTHGGMMWIGQLRPQMMMGGLKQYSCLLSMSKVVGDSNGTSILNDSQIYYFFNEKLIYLLLCVHLLEEYVLNKV